MGRRKLWGSRDIPHCPDPERYTLVKSSAGKVRPHWRHKRGTFNEANLNKPFGENASQSVISGPAGKLVMDRLRPFMRDMYLGRVHLTVANRLRTVLKNKGVMNYSLLKGLEMQPDYPLDGLLTAHYKVAINGDVLRVTIPLEEMSVNRQGPMVTDYYFELILLTGRPSEPHKLRVTNAESQLYPYEFQGNDICSLSVMLPEKNVPWMALLKIGSLEGDELAVHCKHYGMRVVEVG